MTSELKHRLFDLTHRIKTAQSGDECWTLCHKELEAYGVSSVCYGVLPTPGEYRSVGFTQSGYYRTSHPREWIETIGSEVLLDNELTAETITNSSNQVIWHDESLWDDATDEQKLAAEIENDLGLGIGISLNLSHLTNDAFSGLGNAVAGIGLSMGDIRKSDFDSHWVEYSNHIVDVSALLDLSLRKDYPNTIVGLTTREKDILLCIAHGCRIDEIASKLHRSIKTIEKQLATAKLKLKARTRDQAVVKALVLGLIQP